MRTKKDIELNDSLVKMLIVLLWVTAACMTLRFVINIVVDEANILYFLRSYLKVSDTMILSVRFVLIPFIPNLLYIATFALFLHWLSRVYSNLNTLGGSMPEALINVVLFWFIPVFNFYKPYGIMKNIYGEANRLAAEKGVIERLDDKVINVWWFFVILVWVALIVELIFQIQDQDTLFLTFRKSETTIILPILLTIRIVKSYNIMENRLLKSVKAK